MKQQEATATLPELLLERDSALPLYLQLSRAIEAEIKGGRFGAGRMLPSETALCRHLSISRITVRQAFDDLVSKSLIERRQGKGTFVARPLIRTGLTGADSLFDTLFAQKHAPSSRLLTFGLQDPPADIAPLFDCPEGGQLLRLDRLYLLNDRPVGMAVGWLRAEVAAVSREEAESHSTANLIERVFGQPIRKSEVSIRAASVGREIAQHLQLNERAPVLVLHRRRLLQDGRIADVVRAYMTAESYEFTIDNVLTLNGNPSLTLVAA